MCKIITSVNTLNMESAMKNKAEALLKLTTADEASSKVKKADADAKKALTAVNKSRQNDVFSSVIADKDAHPLVTLSKVGVFKSAGFKLPDEGKADIKYTDTDSLLSLTAFYDHAATNKTDLGSKSDWRSLVRDAVHLSVIKLAQGIKDDVPALMIKLNASAAVMEAVKNGKKNKDTGEMSYSVVQDALQRALDAIYFDKGERTDDQNQYRIGRDSCRWLEASFGINKTTGHVIAPEDETCYNRMFMILRHVLGGMVYTFEVKGK